MAPLSDDIITMLNQATDHDKFALAQLVSVFERSDQRARELRLAIIDHLLQTNKLPRATVLGFSGTPGAGKSSLLGKLALQILDSEPEKSIAILAIDPSSHKSGGSILGDRTRTQFPLKDKRVYFRSQASELDLGGLGQSTFPVCQLLSFFFDFLFIETVGIGQSEIEVRHLADKIFLVMQPFAGDQVQFMKSGIMEVPDVFIINKCDEEKLAQKSYHQLKSSLRFLQPITGNDDAIPPVFLTSATHNRGIDTLADFISEQTGAVAGRYESRQKYFLQKSIGREYGQWGLRLLEEKNFFEALGANYEENLLKAEGLVRVKLSRA